MIGTPRSNLYKKLEQYGISQETGRLNAASTLQPDALSGTLRAPQCGQTIAAPCRGCKPRERGEESPNSTGQCAG